MARVRKAVFPVAGLGTRFLPATKANPKEMLPVVDKPVVQYAAEEAVAAGAEVLIFITGRNKAPISDHFDISYELENELERKNKHELLKVAREVVPEGVDCIYIRQNLPLGLGHAVNRAKNIVGNDPFFVVLPDDLVHSNGKNCLQQMNDAFEEKECSMIGVQQVPDRDVSRYGIIGGEKENDRLTRVTEIVEKPKLEEAPSNWGVIGRYLLTPRIFELLDETRPDAGGEIQLTDAIARLIKEQDVYACDFEGKRYDCGNKLGYLEATVEMALEHPELKDDFWQYLSDFVDQRRNGE